MKIWEENNKAIALVVFKYKWSRMRLCFWRPFTMTNAWFLIENRRYLYYTLEITWNTNPNFEALKYLLKNSDGAPSYMFHKIEITYTQASLKTWMEAISQYYEKNFDPKALNVSFSNEIFSKYLTRCPLYMQHVDYSSDSISFPK